MPHLPGTIIVNQGEMLSRFSQGKFRAPVHRVSAKHKNDRIRLEYFIVEGSVQVRIKCNLAGFLSSKTTLKLANLCAFFSDLNASFVS